MSGFRRCCSVTISQPATRPRPDVGSNCPLSIRIVVVFPAPLWPRKPKISPASTEKDMSSTARRLLNVRERFSSSMAGIRVLYTHSEEFGCRFHSKISPEIETMRNAFLCSLFILLVAITSGAKTVHHYVFFGMDREKI